MTETITYQLKKAYFKLIKACLKGNVKKQKKWDKKIIALELDRKKTGKL